MTSNKITKVVCASIIAVLVHSSVSQALTLDQYYARQDITQYHKNASESPCSATGGDTTTPPIESNQENEQIIFQYFIGKKLSPEQAAGIVGNLWVETGGTFDPAIHQNGGGVGRGIAQWTATERWVDLVNYARTQNRSEWDLIVQLDFIWYEFQGKEKRAYDHLVATVTTPQATDSFLTKYERAGTPHRDKRVLHAEDAFKKYSGLPGIGGSVSSGGCGGNSGESGGTIAGIAEVEFLKGIVERPARCDAGNTSAPGTCGPEIDKYTDSHLEYWCADFVSWVFKEADTPFTGGLSGGWRINSVDDVKGWFQENGIFFGLNDTTYSPQPGDVVIYSYSHTDIVVAVNGSSIVTIGGNTGVDDDQNGSGVGKKTKNIHSSNIVGFGRLK